MEDKRVTQKRQNTSSKSNKTTNKKPTTNRNNNVRKYTPKIDEARETETVKVVRDDKEKKSVGRIIFDVVFWVCISILAVIWLTDFFRVQNDKQPIFCLKEKTHEFSDGEVKECVGLGYKIYNYKRESITAHQFGPLFTKMKK